jgi:hypothetical protein
MKLGWVSFRSLMVLAAVGCGGAPGDDVGTGEGPIHGALVCAGGGKDCPDGAYCKETAIGLCPGPKQTGVCAAKPQLCTRIYSPVCGCDGHTYGNACEAAAAGVAVASTGECKKPGSCSSNADCDNAAYCAFPVGQCGPSGTCAPKPEVCIDIFDPVCGCDGRTYGNSCAAAGAGVNLASEDACPTRPFCGGIAGVPCPGLGECIDDPTDTCDPTGGGADCGGACECRAGAVALCPPGSHFDPAPSVCACVKD